MVKPPELVKVFLPASLLEGADEVRVDVRCRNG